MVADGPDDFDWWVWLVIGLGLLVLVALVALLCCWRRGRGNGRTSKDNSGYMDAVMQQRRLQSAQAHQYGEKTKRGSLGVGILPTVRRRDSSERSSKGASVGSTRAPAWGIGSAAFPDPPPLPAHTGSDSSAPSTPRCPSRRSRPSLRRSSSAKSNSSRSSLKPENSALFTVEL